MFEKVFQALPSWKFVPIALIIFIFPSVAVTVKSGATTIFLLMLIPSVIFGWRGWNNLISEEKILLISFLIFVLFSSLSFINSSDIYESISSFEKYLRFAVFVPMYLYLRKYSIELGTCLVLGIVLGCFVMGLVAIYQHHWMDISRPHGVRNIARFGLVSVTFLLILIVALGSELKNSKILIPGIISSLLISYAIYLNHTRSAILSIIPFAIMLIFFNRTQIKKKHIIIIAIVTFLVSIVFFHPSSPVAQHFISGFIGLKELMDDPLKNYMTDWGIRPHMYYAGLLVFYNSPLIGTGIGDYAQDVQVLIDAGNVYVQHKMMLTSPHNIYINALAETGLIGFLGQLFAICFAPIYCYLKVIKKSPEDNKIKFYSISGLTVSICFLFFGLFHTWTNINNSVSIFLLLHLVFLSNSFQILKRKKC